MANLDIHHDGPNCVVCVSCNKLLKRVSKMTVITGETIEQAVLKLLEAEAQIPAVLQDAEDVKDI